MKQIEFLEKYNIKKEDFDKTGLIWEELLKIYDDYKKYKQELEVPAVNIFNSLMKVNKVHYVRYRIKNEEHVIEKIIRKKIKDNKSEINIENYKNILTDLIGVRAIKLYKEVWIDINSHILKTYRKRGKPIAYYRDGDTKQEIEKYEKQGCKAEKHKYGYRSIHYIIISQNEKQKYTVEIQVRTIFEEAWSEIDHKIRYPYDQEHKTFLEFLLVFNRLAGTADEMGTFIKNLQIEFASKKKETNSNKEIINQLETKLNKLGLDKKDLTTIKEDIEKLKDNDELTDEMRKNILAKFINKIK